MIYPTPQKKVLEEPQLECVGWSLPFSGEGEAHVLERPPAGTLSPVCVTVACAISRFPQAQAGEGLDRVPRVRPVPWACGGSHGEDRAPSTQVSFPAVGLSPKTVLWVCPPVVSQSLGHGKRPGMLLFDSRASCSRVNK